MTGLLLVARNLQGVVFSAGFIFFLDVSHLALAMVFLAMMLYGVVAEKNLTSTFQERVKRNN